METENRVAVPEPFQAGTPMKSEAWAILCLAGFWGWVAAIAGFALRSFPARGEFVARAACLWGGGAMFSFILWFVAMIHV